MITLNYCTGTGLIAGENCPETRIGYYRKSNIPQKCSGKSHNLSDDAFLIDFWENYDTGEIPLYD